MAKNKNRNVGTNTFDPRGPDQRDKKSFRRRMIAFGIVAGVLFLIFVFRLAQFQLLGG